jgi:hypothetical protein
MIILLMLPFLFGNFVEKWVIPYGTIAPGGKILVYDTDHDEQVELIFRRWIPGSVGVYFAEFVPPDSWNIIESQTVDSVLIWDVGDFDNDGFSDLVTHGNASGGAPIPIIAIYESSDSFSYPSSEVWRDTAGPPLVLPISAYDIDQDGKPEIVKDIISVYYYLGLYESTEDNHYELIFADNPDTSQYDAPSSTHAFGDFDGDSNIEFVMGGTGSSSTGAPFWVYECIDDNSYEKVHEDYVPTLNINDCFAVPDADGDGKPEFVVKGYIIPSAQIHAFIFEATGDNTYEIIETFTLYGGDYYGGYSDVGDVDGDSIPEIALEACQNIHVIKSAGNDSFYVWETLPGNNNGSSVRVYDIDDNGLSEVIISGNDETRIYEYQTGIVEETEHIMKDAGLHISPNPFRDVLRITYHAPSDHEAVLQICDACGRFVRQLDGNIGTLYVQTTWDGTDETGKHLPAGIYFIQVKISNKITVRKIIKLE